MSKVGGIFPKGIAPLGVRRPAEEEGGCVKMVPGLEIYRGHPPRRQERLVYATIGPSRVPGAVCCAQSCPDLLRSLETALGVTPRRAIPTLAAP